MNNSFKIVALFVAIATIVPMHALEHNDVKPDDVIGIIGGETTHISEGDLVGTIGGPAVLVTSETDTIIPHEGEHSVDPFTVRLNLNVYLRGAILIGGVVGTLAILANKLSLTNPVSALAYAFVACMSLTTIEQGIKNLCGKRINGYWTTQA